MKQDSVINLNPLVHAPIRLAILSILVNVKSATFSFLKESIRTTDGNLSTHLSKLEEAGYIRIDKSFQGKKPQTTCVITFIGRKAFLDYINRLEEIVKSQKDI